MSGAAHDLRRFTADEYLQMIASGILKDGDRVELVDGEILNMVPQGPDHSALDDDLRDRLYEAYRGTDTCIRDQKPLRCGEFGVPEPDLAVVRGKPRDYLNEHPSGREALLVVEIAKTSQLRDRMKARDYARGEVPVYWLLDVEARSLTVHTRPDAETGHYRTIVSLDETEDVALPDLETRWSVGSLLA